MSSGHLRSVAWVVALLLFGAVVYGSEHRSVAPTRVANPIRVLVAKRTIPKGTNATAIRHAHLYRLAAIPKSQRDRPVGGAIFTPNALAGPVAVLKGQVALHDIPSGSRLTVADFGRVTR